MAKDGLSLLWRRASRSECFDKEILKKILGDEYRDSSHCVVAWLSCFLPFTLYSFWTGVRVKGNPYPVIYR